MTKLLRDVAEGSIVKLKESGIPVEFYVAKHDYEAALNGGGRTLLSRTAPHSKQLWNATGISTYADSTIDTWLNNDYKALFDSHLLNAISTTTFPYTIGGGNDTLSTLSRSFFLLSATELNGGIDQFNNTEGSPTSVNSDMCNCVDVAATRTPAKGYSSRIIYFQNNWGFYYGYDFARDSTFNIVPAFTLPANEVYVLDDGLVVLDTPIISGEDSDLGAKPKGFSLNYTVSSLKGNKPTVTEMVNNTVLRTYTAESGAQQTLEVSTAGLAPAQHTVTITAEIAGETADRFYLFEVPPIWITHSDTELGDKTGNFTIDYIPETYDGTEMTITESLDGEVQRSYTAQSGAEQGMSIAMKSVIDGAHSATITAEADEEVATSTFTFNVPAITLHDGGTIQEFQDENGNPVFPATMARAVFTSSGESVERKIKDVRPASYAMENLVIEKIDTSCTWTAPKAIGQKFRIFAVGGGGASGADVGSRRGGGGAGGYVSIGDFTIMADTEIEIVCGAGGAAVSGADGNAGGTTTFGNLLSAEGGGGGKTTGVGGSGGSGGGGGGYNETGYGTVGGNGGHGSTYGGGGGAGHCASYACGGNGGMYGGGGGGGSAQFSNYGIGGIGGEYGGDGYSYGGVAAELGTHIAEKLCNVLYRAELLASRVGDGGNQGCGGGGYFSQGGSQSTMSSNSYGGAGGGGGGYCGNGGNGSSGGRGGGGGGLFADGSSYGGGAGILDATGANGTGGGCYIVYFKED